MTKLPTKVSGIQEDTLYSESSVSSLTSFRSRGLRLWGKDETVEVPIESGVGQESLSGRNRD